MISKHYQLSGNPVIGRRMEETRRLKTWKSSVGKTMICTTGNKKGGKKKQAEWEESSH